MRNHDPGRAGSARGTRSTRVQDVLDEWGHDAKARLCRARGTIQHSLAAIRELARSAGTDDLAEITPEDALVWLTIQPSVKTAHNKRTSARAVYRWLMLHRRIRTNPLAHIDLPRAPVGRGADPLSLDEARRVISAARRTANDRRCTGLARARFYLFLWGTALRHEEAKVQEWTDIRWRDSSLRVTHDKARRGDIIPVPAWLLREMETWPREGPRIFAKVPSHHSLQRDFQRACVQGRGNWHRFRKGTITTYAQGGVPLHLLAKLSRHRNISVLVNSYITAEWSQLTDAQRLTAI